MALSLPPFSCLPEESTNLIIELMPNVGLSDIVINFTGFAVASIQQLPDSGDTSSLALRLVDSRASSAIATGAWSREIA